MSSTFGTTALIQQWKRQRDQQSAAAGSSTVFGPPGVIAIPRGELVHTSESVTARLEPSVTPTHAPPELLFGALVEKGERTDDGHIILAVTPAYSWFLEELARDPNALYQLDPRKGEELVAGRYEREGWRAILTPRSADGGRDIIATRPDFGTIRIIDQVKCYAPHRVVDAEAVRSLWGVLTSASEIGTSKAIITTTSRFAPGIYTEFKDRMPGRLYLRNGDSLREWLLADRNK